MSIIELSPTLEKVAFLLFLILLTYGLIFSWVNRGTKKNYPLSTLDRSAETVLLFAILAFASLLRLYGWDQDLTPSFYFSAVSELRTAEDLHAGRFVQAWLPKFFDFQVDWAYDSAIIYPVTYFFQLLLGPHLNSPVISGSFWGIGLVVAAWLFGRTYIGPAYGLIFAALAAVSPAAIVWSRIGGLHGTGGLQVLLTMWLGVLAGKKRSSLLSVVAGLSIWTTLYAYKAARISIPLGLLAFAFGLMLGKDNRKSLLAAIVPTLCLCGTLAFCYYALARNISLWDLFWPHYSGYPGAKGETTFQELFTKNIDDITNNFLDVIKFTFINRENRVTRNYSLPPWGVDYGGLNAIGILLLGFIGFLLSLKQLKKHGLLVLFAVAAFSVQVFSPYATRRLLIFDLAWCALASLPLYYFLRLFIEEKTASKRTSWFVFYLSIYLFGTWQFLTISEQTANLKTGSDHSPYGESKIHDGIISKRSKELAYRTRSILKNNESVMLIDSDKVRESTTSPFGLQLYQELAAFEASKTNRYVNFYSDLTNETIPSPLSLRRKRDVNFVQHLSDTILHHQVKRAHIVFECASVWEREFANILKEIGPKILEYETPLCERRGFSLVFDNSQFEELRTVFARLANDFVELQEQDWTFDLLKRQTLLGGFPVFLGPKNKVPPKKIEDIDWVRATFYNIQDKDKILVEHSFGHTAGVKLDLENNKITVHDQWGSLVTVGLDVSSEPAIRYTSLGRSGRYCAVHHNDAWWIVNPRNGRLKTEFELGSWLPERLWLGISVLDPKRLILASADNYILIIEPSEKKIVAEFPARIWPLLDPFERSCVQLAAHDGILVTHSILTQIIRGYSVENGEPLFAVFPSTVGIPYVHTISAFPSGIAIDTGSDILIGKFRRKDISGDKRY